MTERNADMLSDRIYSIRQQYHYSQEKFAEKLGVSRQAVQRWGSGDYSKTVCLAVQCGFDTDCNGATAGSIIGMMVGCDGIDEKWTEPIGGLLNTSVYNRAVSIDEFVDMMMRHMKQN